MTVRRVLCGFIATMVLLLLAWGSVSARAAAGWSETGSLVKGRYAPRAVLLPSGKVLVAGGDIGETFPTSTEIYDPRAGSWTPAAPMPQGRQGFSLLRLRSGRILLVGGVVRGNTRGRGGEVYDPATDRWSQVDGPRATGAAAVLPDGKVLVVNGFENDPKLYDPDTGTWSDAGSMLEPREQEAATLLRDGRVLVTGGASLESAPFPGALHASAEIYDEHTNSWSSAGSMSMGRVAHTATLLADGRVLVTGGLLPDPAEQGFLPTNSADVYDPATNTWSAVSPMSSSRSSHTATRLDDGGVLIAGHIGGSDVSEIFNPDSDAWSAPFLGGPKFVTSATKLQNGRVLVTSESDTPDHSGARLYTPATSLSAGSLYFGGQPVGQTTGIAYVPVTNTGKDSMFVSHPRIEGAHPGDFAAATDACSGVAVAPGQTCVIGVRFTPATAGVRTALLRFSDNTPQGASLVPLTGTGLAATGGPVGPPGPRGPRGARGAKGNPGRDAKVHCTIRKLKHTRRWRVACRITYPKGTRHGTVRARLSRGNAVFARADRRLHGRRTKLRLHATRRRLHRGRFKLTVTLSTAGRNRATTTRVRLR